MCYASFKGIICYLVMVFDGEHTPYYPEIDLELGNVIPIEVPAIAEGVWWPKKEYMKGYLIEPDELGFLQFTVDYLYHSEDNQLYSALPYNSLDQDFDEFVTGTDYDLFTKNFEDGLVQADFDGNGFVNGNDFDLFLELWNR